jgi:hypothetical protein
MVEASHAHQAPMAKASSPVEPSPQPTLTPVETLSHSELAFHSILPVLTDPHPRQNPIQASWPSMGVDAVKTPSNVALTSNVLLRFQKRPDPIGSGLRLQPLQACRPGRMMLQVKFDSFKRSLTQRFHFNTSAGLLELELAQS